MEISGFPTLNLTLCRLPSNGGGICKYQVVCNQMVCSLIRHSQVLCIRREEDSVLSLTTETLVRGIEGAEKILTIDPSVHARDAHSKLDLVAHLISMEILVIISHLVSSDPL